MKMKKRKRIVVGRSISLEDRYTHGEIGVQTSYNVYSRHELAKKNKTAMTKLYILKLTLLEEKSLV